MRGQPIITGLLLAATSFHGAGPSGAPAADIPAGTIAFASLAPRGWDLYVADVHSLESRRLTDHPALDYNALYSPDGKQIAFVSERDGSKNLYLMNSDGSGLRQLTRGDWTDTMCDWSPTGG